MFILFIGFNACTLNYKDERGFICVRNEAEKRNKVIREVYVKDKEEEGYERIWKGNLRVGSCEFINVD